ncbi:MAG: DUF4911 domain-containing protein [Pseudomonadota bacterium]
MTAVEVESSKLYLRISPRQIHYLKFLLEGYDGMAVLSTMDAVSGLVLVSYPEHSSRFLFSLLNELAPVLVLSS